MLRLKIPRITKLDLRTDEARRRDPSVIVWDFPSVPNTMTPTILYRDGAGRMRWRGLPLSLLTNRTFNYPYRSEVAR